MKIRKIMNVIKKKFVFKRINNCLMALHSMFVKYTLTKINNKLFYPYGSHFLKKNVKLKCAVIVLNK